MVYGERTRRMMPRSRMRMLIVCIACERFWISVYLDLIKEIRKMHLLSEHAINILAKQS